MPPCFMPLIIRHSHHFSFIWVTNDCRIFIKRELLRSSKIALMLAYISVCLCVCHEVSHWNKADLSLCQSHIVFKLMQSLVSQHTHRYTIFSFAINLALYCLRLSSSRNQSTKLIEVLNCLLNTLTRVVAKNIVTTYHEQKRRFL